MSCAILISFNFPGITLITTRF